MLQDLIQFFESLGRADTLHFIRDAVCDYVASCHNPPDASSVMILGGLVTTENRRYKMTVEGWDILYAHFWDVVHWTNIESFCIDFEDVVLINQLIAMGKYKNIPDGGPEWVKKDRGMKRDYFEFIIINQAPSQEFRILDEIADALSLVSGDVQPEKNHGKDYSKLYPKSGTKQVAGSRES